MSGVVDTSRSAYASLPLSRLQSVVLDCIRENPGCDDHFIVQETGMTLNSVNGRRNELMNMKLIECSGKAIGKTGRRTQRYKVRGGC